MKQRKGHNFEDENTQCRKSSWDVRTFCSRQILEFETDGQRQHQCRRQFELVVDDGHDKDYLFLSMADSTVHCIYTPVGDFLC